MKNLYSSRAVVLFWPFGVALALGGCAADTADAEPGVEESEVRTARCPATLELGFEKPTVAASTPTTTHDGSPLSGPEVGRVADGMTEARGLDAFTVSLSLDRKKSGRCYYAGAAGADTHATFRTKGGKDILDVHYGKFRMYLFPSEYSAEGLKLEPGAEVTFFVNVAASGPFSDGASFNVAIGKTKLAPDAALSADRRFIADVARDIGEYFHYEHSAYAQNIAPMAFSALPQALRDKAAALAADERRSVRDGGDPNGDAFPSDEAYAIVRDGRTVGYVLPIEHAIDHPLWDGSGVHFYVDAEGEVVTDVPWTG